MKELMNYYTCLKIGPFYKTETSSYVIHRNKFNYVKLNCTEICVSPLYNPSGSVNNFTTSTNTDSLCGINTPTVQNLYDPLLKYAI